MKRNTSPAYHGGAAAGPGSASGRRPLKRTRSKHDSVPLIFFACFVINCCMAFAFPRSYPIATTWGGRNATCATGVKKALLGRGERPPWVHETGGRLKGAFVSWLQAKRLRSLERGTAPAGRGHSVSLAYMLCAEAGIGRRAASSRAGTGVELTDWWQT